MIEIVQSFVCFSLVRTAQLTIKAILADANHLNNQKEGTREVRGVPYYVCGGNLIWFFYLFIQLTQVVMRAVTTTQCNVDVENRWKSPHSFTHTLTLTIFVSLPTTEQHKRRLSIHVCNECNSIWFFKAKFNRCRSMCETNITSNTAIVARYCCCCGCHHYYCAPQPKFFQRKTTTK